MGSLYAKDVIDNAWSNVGAVCGKTNEFSAELDSIDYFNGKKNGVANSCAIFLNDMTYRSTRNSDLEIDPDKWDSYYFLYQPSNPASNCGAGCTQQVGYFSSGGAFFTDSSKAEKGDWIFFTNDGGETYYHVGLIVGWGYVEELGEDGFTTVEGNTNGGYVAYHYYSYSDSRIGGFGRPRYDGWECPTGAKEPNNPKEDSKPKPTPDPEPTPEPTPNPEPTPTPDPEPTGSKYVVRVETKLNVRTGPGTDNEIVAQLKNGDEVVVVAIQDGWGCIGKWMWVCMDYLEGPIIENGTWYKVSVNTKLNVRYGPGTDYPITYQLDNGDTVCVTETDGNWGKIGFDAWVCMDYLE